jgi:hypothetical protein
MGMFLRWQTEAMGGTVRTLVPIFMDNQGAISLANNTIGPNRNLHMHVGYFHVRDLVEGHEYIIHYVSTNDQLAGMLCTDKGSASFMRSSTWPRGWRYLSNKHGTWELKTLR